MGTQILSREPNPACSLQNWPLELHELARWIDWVHGEPPPLHFNRSLLESADAFLAQATARETSEGIAQAIIRLHAHYPDGRKISQDQWRHLLPDWIDDFADVPALFLREACRRWRNSPTERFAPTAGPLKAKMSEELGTLNSLIRNVAVLRAFLDGDEDWHRGPWPRRRTSR